jgi:hypothetical protein
MNTKINTIEVDELISEDANNISKLFYNHIFGNQDNSVQIISHLLDNYIRVPYLNKENELIIGGYDTNNINCLKQHPFLHETAYQAFAFYIKDDFDWSEHKIFERRLQIFILTAKKFKDVFNEVYYRNRYGRTVLQQISLNFNENTYKFYPDYFKEFIEENILNKYNLIQAKSNIKNDRDFRIIAPKPGDFGLYTKKLIKFKIQDGIEKKIL